MNFNPLTAESLTEITKYGALRNIYTSEGQFTNQFIWAGYYKTQYHVNDKYLFYLMEINNQKSTMMPYCKTEDIIPAFFEIKDYFNQELHLPLKMYIVDDLVVETLKTSERFLAEFDMSEDRDCFDYIYEAQKLKTLSGKALHKKKNHLNSFLKEYDGRFEYRRLCCSDMDEIQAFHRRWIDERKIEGRVNLIANEEEGIDRIFQNCSHLNCRLGGVYIDGKLESYTVGSYAPHLKCAFIHVEKANLEFNGLYNYINQQFLINEFPEAEIVNREDDLGQEGLRKAKLSYKPLRLEKKTNIFQKQ
jgi:Uncharacterized conserved protein